MRKKSQKELPKLNNLILEVIKNLEEDMKEIETSISEMEILLFGTSFVEGGLLSEIKNNISIGPQRRLSYSHLVIKVMMDIEEIKFNQDKLRRLVNDTISKIKKIIDKEDIDTNKILIGLDMVREEADDIYTKIEEQVNIIYLEMKDDRERMGDIQKINQILKEGWDYYKRLSYIQNIRDLLEKISRLVSDYHTLNLIYIGKPEEKIKGVFDKIENVINDYEKIMKEIPTETEEERDERLEGLTELEKDVFIRIRDRTWIGYKEYVKEVRIPQRDVEFAVKKLQNIGLVKLEKLRLKLNEEGYEKG